MQVRKKPVVVEAIHYDGNWSTIVDWMCEISADGLAFPLGTSPPIVRNIDGSLTIFTLEGELVAEIGDWIIRGVAGEFYPCKPDIFEKTYDSID